MRLRNPNKVTTAIPKSKLVGGGNVLVHWGVEETHMLRGMGIDVPSPISARYNWPGQYKPFDHQKTTAEFLTLHKRAFCFSEMGTGKTLSAIWAADFLMTHKVVRRALIISPLSIMDSAWRADLFKAAMHRTVDTAYGAANKRKRIINSGAEFVIINYDGVSIVQEEIKAAGFDLIIVDEATHYKTATTKRWKALRNLITEDTWLWMMTGTPAAQAPTDAYGLAKLVNPAGTPKFFGTFRDMVMVKNGPFRWDPRKSAVDTVHKVLQPAIRFTKEQCLDLPDMLYTSRDVGMTTQQRAYYDKLRKELILEAAGSEVTAVNAAVKMNKLLQIACGAVYTDDSDSLLFDISGRYNVLREVIAESSHKVLVFVPYRNAIDRLHEELNKDNIPTEVISGAIKPHDRTDIFRRFQTATDPRVLLIQPQAAAHGVTLTAANTVVWWSPTASLETYAQANARVHRAGQVNKCMVVHLEGAPVERKLYAMLSKRVDVHSQLVNLYKELLD